MIYPGPLVPFFVKNDCNWNDPWSHKISSRLTSEVTRKRCYEGALAAATAALAVPDKMWSVEHVFIRGLSMIETSTRAVWVSAGLP